MTLLQNCFDFTDDGELCMYDVDDELCMLFFNERGVRYRPFLKTF